MTPTPGQPPLSPPRKQLRYEISRLATLRNLVLAAVIALSCLGIVVVVAYYSARRPLPVEIPPIPPDGAVGLNAVPAADLKHKHKLIPPTPEILAQLPADTAPVVYEVPRKLQGAQREEFVRQLQQQAGARRGPWAQYATAGVRVFQEDAQGNLIEPCPSIAVERDQSWGHTVAFSSDGQHRYHTYQFKYACGHPVFVTPDPYRDLMYADPEAVAQEYAQRLCHDCESQRKYQDAQRKATDARQSDTGR